MIEHAGVKTVLTTILKVQAFTLKRLLLTQRQVFQIPPDEVDAEAARSETMQQAMRAADASLQRLRADVEKLNAEVFVLPAMEL